MKTAIYSPYLDTLGGGERYIATIAEIASKIGQVDILLDEHLFSLGKDQIKKKLIERFNLDLSAVNFIRGPIGKNSSSLERLFFLPAYDNLFYLTDGSIFYPTARKNILHIQSPLVGQPSKSFWGKFKLKRWNIIIYNSKFTQENSQKNWPINSEIIYPPVDVEHIKPFKKKNYILSVGRFFGFLKDKKHDLLIKDFKKLYERGKLKGWSLHLVGSTSEGDNVYLNELRDQSKGYPIYFYPNLEYKNLIRLYGESAIFWHAAGFDEDDPTKMEHFGISTVEAMAGGCVPVVIGKGGQTEIVEDGKTGFLWNTLDEFESKSLHLMEAEKLRLQMSKRAIKKAEDFDKSIFEKKIKGLLSI